MQAALRPSKREFEVRISVRFLKDPRISADAKALRAVIGAFADGHTGVSFVGLKKLQDTLRWSRRRRERAQSELAKAGWLRLNWKRGARGRWAKRIFELCDPSTVARFERSGETEQLITYYSQSQVMSSMTMNLTENQSQESPAGVTLHDLDPSPRD
jgi:hypothetical protein